MHMVLWLSDRYEASSIIRIPWDVTMGPPAADYWAEYRTDVTPWNFTMVPWVTWLVWILFAVTTVALLVRVRRQRWWRLSLWIVTALTAASWIPALLISWTENHYWDVTGVRAAWRGTIDGIFDAMMLLTLALFVTWFVVGIKETVRLATPDKVEHPQV